MNTVADDRSNAIAAHPPGCVGDDSNFIVEQNPKPAIREDLVNDAFDREQFFFCHKPQFVFAEAPLSGQLVASWRYVGRRREAPKTVDIG